VLEQPEQPAFDLFAGRIGRAYRLLTLASLAGMVVFIATIIVAAVSPSEFWFAVLRGVLVLYLAISLARAIVGQVNARKRRQAAAVSAAGASTASIDQTP